jgi:hypothetical protein
MKDFSEHPINLITELEVFIGHILNKTGVQTHRQRERSIKLKDAFDRIASWILTQMRPSGPLTGYTSSFDALERCLACVHVAGEPDTRDLGHRRSRWTGLDSFRIVAACALLMEIEEHEKFPQDLASNLNADLEGVDMPIDMYPLGQSIKGSDGSYTMDSFSMHKLLRAIYSE